MTAWIVLDVPEGWFSEFVTWQFHAGSAAGGPGERVAVPAGVVTAEVIALVAIPRVHAVGRARVRVEVPDGCVVVISLPAFDTASRGDVKRAELSST